MHSDSTITVDQERAIKVLIADHTGALLEQVHAKTTEAIATNQETIIATIQQRIVEAVNHNQKVIIATAQNPSPENGTKRWQIIMAVIPIVLTSLFGVGLSVLGYFIWETQASSQQRIDQTNARLQQSIDQTNARQSTRLSFTVEFYKRRFTAYDKLYPQVIRLREALDASYREEATRTLYTDEAIRALSELSRHSRAERLYLSDSISQEIDEIWVIGIKILRGDSGQTSEERTTEIARRVADLEKHMKKDLWSEPFD